MQDKLPYQKIQIGYGILGIALAAEISLIVCAARFANPAAGILFTLLLAFLSACFFSLQVTADETLLRLKFGVGLVRKEIRLSEILSCGRIKSFFLAGWGLKRIGRTRGWSYSVSGFEAVELKMKDGQILRIGTADPEGLLQALQKRIK